MWRGDWAILLKIVYFVEMRPLKIERAPNVVMGNYKEMKEKYIEIKEWVKRNVSPAFLVMLFLSLTLWYLTKLGHTYTATVPMTVQIEETKVPIECVAEGTGYKIVRYRFTKRKPLQIKRNRVHISPSPKSKGSYIIDPLSLQNAISSEVKGLSIISVGDLPEIKLEE